jgi:hypothetical protein
MQPVMIASDAELWSLSFGNGIYHASGCLKPGSTINHEPRSGAARQDSALFLPAGL